MEQNGIPVIAKASSPVIYLSDHKDCLEQNANQASVCIINQPVLVERHRVPRVMTLSHAMILNKLAGCLLSFDPGGPSCGDILANDTLYFSQQKVGLENDLEVMNNKHKKGYVAAGEVLYNEHKMFKSFESTAHELVQLSWRLNNPTQLSNYFQIGGG